MLCFGRPPDLPFLRLADVNKSRSFGQQPNGHLRTYLLDRLWWVHRPPSLEVRRQRFTSRISNATSAPTRGHLSIITIVFIYNDWVLTHDSVGQSSDSITTVTFDAPGLGDRSYLLTDGIQAAVVDPQRDPAPYLQEALKLGVTITAVLETHIHNDYVSGGIALARMTAATYAVPAGESVAFSGECRELEDGDSFEVGRLTITAIATAGHTANHLAYAVGVAAHGYAEKTVVCTGGSLLVNATGRTDLLGSDLAEGLAHSQWRSVRRLLKTLPRDARILPTHGFGSFCSAVPTNGDTPTVTTIGEQLAKNPAALLDEDDFVTGLLADLPPIPTYYRYMAPLNRKGVDAPRFDPVPELQARDLVAAMGDSKWVVDLRQRRIFAAEHIPGTLNIELGPSLTTYLGWIVPWDGNLVLLAEQQDEIDDARRRISRIGRDELGGSAIWPAAAPGKGADRQGLGTRTASYPVATFTDLARQLGRPRDIPPARRRCPTPSRVARRSHSRCLSYPAPRAQRQEVRASRRRAGMGALPRPDFEPRSRPR